MRFSVDERFFDLFPSLKIGVLVCRVDNTTYGDDNLESILERTREDFRQIQPQDHPRIRVWREAFRKLGFSPSKYMSSIESLVRRAVKGGPFPRINPVVDLYNAISLKHLVPVGGHDMAAVGGNISLGFAEGTEIFVSMGTLEREVVEKGEAVYKDEREILTRRWVWRQSENDKVTAHTRYLFVPVDVMDGLPEGVCEEVLTDMEENLLGKGRGILLHKDILSALRSSTTFSL